MFRLTLFVFAFTVAFNGSTAASAQAVTRPVEKPAANAVSKLNAAGKVLTKVIAPLNVLATARDIIEGVTTTRKPTATDVVLGLTRTSARLEVMTSEGQIFLEGSDESVLGDNSFKLMIPCKFRYVVDLKKLKKQDIRVDLNRRVITVRMPAAELDEPTPDRERMQILQETNPFFRSRASFMELRDSVLAEKLKPRARERGEEDVYSATNAGRAELQKFLQHLYKATMSDFRVIVE